VQSDLLSDLSTRVVAPLRLAAHYSGKSMATLMPGFSVEGQEVIALIQQLAAVPPRAIGAEVADLSDRRCDIVAALDFKEPSLCTLLCLCCDRPIFHPYTASYWKSSRSIWVIAATKAVCIAMSTPVPAVKRA
jgi:toxin CcdB